MIINVWIYLVLTLYSVLNIIVPFSGSATVTPLLAILTDPHRAVGLATFYFFLTAVIRVVLFRKHIVWNEIKSLWVPSVTMAAIGAAALIAVPSRILLFIVFASTLYFLFKKVRPETEQKKSKLTNYFVGLLSGFLQGTGLAGSDLRNTYLYAQGLTIAQLHGTTVVIGGSNFLVATLVRLSTHQLSIPDLQPLLYIVPFMVVGIWIGRHFLYKLPKKVTDMIIIGTMTVVTVLLGMKLLQGGL